jgi:hypothetical protein
MFCLSRFGFTHQDITNHTFFLCFLRKKDTCTWWKKNRDMENWCLWAKVGFSYSGVAVSCILPVKIGPHASKFHKLPIFPVSSQEKRPLHMVNQKIGYETLMPLSHGFICIWVCGSITPFACQDLASHIKLSQIYPFFLCFPMKKDLCTWWIKKIDMANW